MSFLTFMCGRSEEVPNLKSQLLNEEIIFLKQKSNLSKPVPTTVALEGTPVEETTGVRLSPPCHLTCSILGMPLLPVLTKMQCPHF